jgi:hypothetical protein
MLPSTAGASDQQGKVIQVAGDAGSPMVFLLSGTRTSTPTCATDGWFALPATSTDNGRALLSLILTAFAANKTVTVHGTGSCTAFSTREDVAWLIIE